MAIKLQISPKGSGIDPCCCSPADCCMYPASGLGVTYEADDLPETIIWNQFHLEVTATMTLNKNGSIYEGSGWGYSGDWEGPILPTPVKLIAGNDYGPEVTWEVWHYDLVIGSLGNCLIDGDGNLTPGNDAVEDQFSPSYTVEDTVVERVDLCNWEDTFGGDEAALSFVPAKQKWEARYFGVTVTKTGNQNTPIGTYEGSDSQGNSVTFEVTE